MMNLEVVKQVLNVMVCSSLAVGWVYPHLKEGLAREHLFMETVGERPLIPRTIIKLGLTVGERLLFYGRR